MTPQLIAVLAYALLAVVLVGVPAAVLVRRGRRLRVARARDADAARAAVARLQERVDGLAEELATTQREAARALREREYVITSLVEGEIGYESVATPSGDVTSSSVAHRRRRTVGRHVAPPALEQQLVRALARQRQPGVQADRARELAAQAALKAVSFAAGVRRALDPEVRDRAAAEAHVARRRSRRLRKQELKEARRLVRQVRGDSQGRRGSEHAA